MIYFIRRADGTGPIKIGCSISVHNRGKELARHAGHPLRVLATKPGYFREERLTHEMFAADRIQGEWFNPSESLLSHIEELVANGEVQDIDLPSRRPGRKPSGKPRLPAALQIKGGTKWKEWVEAFAASHGGNVSVLVEKALYFHAFEKGYDRPPPREE